MFGRIKLTKNADPDKHSYSGYGIGFDVCGYFSLPDCNAGKNVIIFGADMSSSVHIDNKGKHILILGKGTTAEIQYPIKFIRPSIKLCLSQYYNGSNGFLFANATKMYQFKAKDSEIKKYPLCLGNISQLIHEKKTGLNGYVYEFSVDYNILLILVILLIFINI